jgi:lipoate---protein ligase
MSEEWRLLLTGQHNAAENMAIDRAILTAHSRGLVPPTVRFYSWSPPAISIGYFQRLYEEIDIEACKKHGVEYVRRITGGGAVFHEHELTYSLVISEKHPKIDTNILESYGSICGAVMKGLSYLDIVSTYAPINDILVNGKKISGNAQTRKQKTVLQHGTIIMDVDVEKMFSLLKVPNEKIKDKLISDVKQRVTSVKSQMDVMIPFDTVAEAMKKGFEDTFDVKLQLGQLTSDEHELTEEYIDTCFGTKEWNDQRL